MSVFSRSDLALDRDGQGRFLPWLIAFMVFLAVLAMAGVMVLSALVDRWDRGVTGTLSVQIAPGESPAVDERRRQAALLILRATPGVERADVVASAEIEQLLKPWLGDDIGTALPLPQLIDVTLAPDAALDVDALQRRLQEAVPSATIDDHRVWLDRLVQIFETARLFALIIVGLIMAATIGTIIFTTRTALAIHHEAIEVLHLIGARDAYIARQFANRALIMGIKGALLGLLGALPCLYGLSWVASKMDSVMIPEISVGLGHWAILAVIPVFVALIAAIAARLTVMATLSRML